VGLILDTSILIASERLGENVEDILRKARAAQANSMWPCPLSARSSSRTAFTGRKPANKGIGDAKFEAFPTHSQS
jgi:hypothetical protein